MDPESDNSTLVKYDNPRLVTTTNPDTNNKKGRRLISTARVSCSKTEDILSSILPPREFTTSDRQLWVQSVSSTPSTRQDVIALEKQLDSKLQDGEVRASGLCPVREKLYAQPHNTRKCFDEIIRQTVVNCTERGLLLQRIKDEMDATISTYMTLYESSVAFGIRKALQAEQKKAKIDEWLEQLMGENVEKERRLKELTKRCEDLTRRAEERRLVDQECHERKLEALKRANLHLKCLLEETLATTSMNELN